jgi:hypothetical protein
MSWHRQLVCARFSCVCPVLILGHAKRRPNPSPGTTVELPLLGSVLETELPQAIDSQQSTETSSFRQKFDPRRHVCRQSPPESATGLNHRCIDSRVNGTSNASPSDAVSGLLDTFMVYMGMSRALRAYPYLWAVSGSNKSSGLVVAGPSSSGIALIS